MTHKNHTVMFKCAHFPKTDFMRINDPVAGGISIYVEERDPGQDDDGISDSAAIVLSFEDAELLLADLQVRIPRVKEAQLTKLIAGNKS